MKYNKEDFDLCVVGLTFSFKTGNEFYIVDILISVYMFVCFVNLNIGLSNVKLFNVKLF